VNELAFRTVEMAAATTPLIELTDIRKTFFTGEDIQVDALRGVSLRSIRANSSPSWAHRARANRR
jgi:hypothetical protein